MRNWSVLLAGAIVAGSLGTVRGDQVTIVLDHQINIGLGNAITPVGKTPAGVDRLTFESEAGVGFARLHLVKDNGMGNYYDGPDINLIKAGIGPVDLSMPGSTIQFVARYYQDPADYPPNTPWNRHDAPIGLILTTPSGNRLYTWPYQAHYGDGPYPTWNTITVDANVAALPKTNISDQGTPDMSHVTSVHFWGTDWAGQGNDFVDVHSLTLASPVPAPAGLWLGLVGAAGLIRLRMRGKRTP